MITHPWRKAIPPHHLGAAQALRCLSQGLERRPRARSSEVDPTSDVNRPLKQKELEPDSFNLKLSGSKQTTDDNTPSCGAGWQALDRMRGFPFGQTKTPDGGMFPHDHGGWAMPVSWAERSLAYLYPGSEGIRIYHARAWRRRPRQINPLPRLRTDRGNFSGASMLSLERDLTQRPSGFSEIPRPSSIICSRPGPIDATVANHAYRSVHAGKPANSTSPHSTQNESQVAGGDPDGH
jgi:hypothetical protein